MELSPSAERARSARQIVLDLAAAWKPPPPPRPDPVSCTLLAERWLEERAARPPPPEPPPPAVVQLLEALGHPAARAALAALVRETVTQLALDKKGPPHLCRTIDTPPGYPPPTTR